MVHQCGVDVIQGRGWGNVYLALIEVYMYCGQPVMPGPTTLACDAG